MKQLTLVAAVALALAAFGAGSAPVAATLTDRSLPLVLVGSGRVLDLALIDAGGYWGAIVTAGPAAARLDAPEGTVAGRAELRLRSSSGEPLRRTGDLVVSRPQPFVCTSSGSLRLRLSGQGEDVHVAVRRSDSGSGIRVHVCLPSMTGTVERMRLVLTLVRLPAKGVLYVNALLGTECCDHDLFALTSRYAHTHHNRSV
jgi:hypothetical protein